MAALWVQVPMPYPAKQVSQSFGSFFSRQLCLTALYLYTRVFVSSHLMGLCRCPCVLVYCVFSMNMYLLSVSENSVLGRDKSQSLRVFVV